MTATVTTPLLVYLDSSDFSTLSRSNLSPEHEGLKQQLAAWANSGQVRFVFSGTHLMEMAPLNSAYTPAAAARADLLVSLCSRNALVSLDRLIALELKVLADLSSELPRALSSNGEWYPDWGQMISPVEWVDAARDVGVKTGPSLCIELNQRTGARK